MDAARLASCALLAFLGCCASRAHAQDPPKARVPLGASCQVDADCDDHVFCNGIEQCGNGAVCASTPSQCSAGRREVCNEATARCDVFRDDRDGDGHFSEATGGDDCDDGDGRNFPGNPEVWDAADHDEDCNWASHGVPAVFGPIPAPGRGQACSGETLVVLTRAEPVRDSASDSMAEVSCGPGMGCSAPGVCVAKGPGYVAPASLGPLPQGRQAWNPPAPPSPLPGQGAGSSQPVAGAELRRALAAPVPMRPLVPKGPPAAVPVSKAPVAVPVAGPRPACPKGEAYSPAVKKCIPVPPG